jgi:hypothetical protein
MNYTRILVVAPPYSSDCGGIMVLHKLVSNLINLGYDAYLYPMLGTDWFTVSKDNKYAVTTEVDQENDIVIYPEIIEGNPLNVKKVVRYVLNFARPELKQFGENDFWIYYSERFYDGKKDKNILHIVDPKLDFYIDLGRERRHDAFTYRKKEGDPNLTLIHPKHSVEIGHNVYDNELREIFSYIKRFYVYDTETFLSVIASLCGCEVVIVPYNGLTKQDIIDKQPVFKYGIAYGLDDLEYANKTRNLLRDELRNIEYIAYHHTRTIIEKIIQYYES